MPDNDPYLASIKPAVPTLASQPKARSEIKALFTTNDAEELIFNSFRRDRTSRVKGLSDLFDSFLSPAWTAVSARTCLASGWLITDRGADISNAKPREQVR
jgi:hypothetical protein